MDRGVCVLHFLNFSKFLRNVFSLGGNVVTQDTLLVNKRLITKMLVIDQDCELARDMFGRLNVTIAFDY